MLGSILTWIVLAAALGHADAIRLLTAVMLVRTARTFTMLDTAAAVRRRHGAPEGVVRKTLRRAIRIELVSLAAAALLLAGMIVVLWEINQEEIARMTMLVAAGLPVRHFAPAAGGRRRASVFRSALTWSGLALAVLAFSAGLGWGSFALILGVREWVALAIALTPALRPPMGPASSAMEAPLTWREVAAITGTRARHRLMYRIGKALLTVFGPFGSIAARTARGMGAHRRIVPRSAWPVAAVAAGAMAAALILPVVLAKPVTMLISASLLRIAAAAGNVLLWWPFASRQPDDYAEDDEDDD